MQATFLSPSLFGNSGSHLTSVQLITIDQGELVMLEWREVPLAWSCVICDFGLLGWRMCEVVVVVGVDR